MDKSIKNVISFFLIEKKRIIILLVFVFLFLIFSKKFFKQSTNQNQIILAKVEKGTIVSAISASGTVLPSNIFNVTTQASGVVKKVFVKEGDSVVVGEKIAEIELDLDGAQQFAQANASYISALNSLNTSKNNLRSAQATLDKVYDDIKGHDTDETFAMRETRTKAEVARDNAYGSVKLASANLKTAEYNLRLNSPVITAPVPGEIASIAIAEGMLLGSQTTTTGTRTTQKVASIVKEGKQLISVNISEIDVYKVKNNQKATVIFDSIPDKTFSGKVVAIDRIGSKTNNVVNYPAIIELDTNPDLILPNMAVSANIIIETKSDVLLIPSQALQTKDNQYFVKVLRNGKEEEVQVEIGLQSDTQTEILSGLKEGDEVVVGQETTAQNQTEGGSVFGGGFGGAFRGGRFVFTQRR